MDVSGCCFDAVDITCETSYYSLSIILHAIQITSGPQPSVLFLPLSSMLPMVPIILAGDINLSTVNWDEMSSINAYEQECVDIFLDYNLSNNPYCWIKPALMVQHWQEWLEPKLETFVPRKTAHRSSLPHWITPSTSNVIRRLKIADTRAEKGVKTEEQ